MNEEFASSSVERLPPGSEWLFVKYYVSNGALERLLVESLLPAIQGLVASGAIDSWHFIRYADPDPHLRLRVHGLREALLGTALGGLVDSAADWLQSGLVQRIQVDTYEREVGRYGGYRQLAICEQMFHVDSEAASAIIQCDSGDDCAVDRAQLLVSGVRDTYAAAGLNGDAALSVMRRARERQAAGFGFTDKASRVAFDRAFRDWRVITGAGHRSRSEASGFLVSGRRILERRRRSLEKLLAAFGAIERSSNVGVGDVVVLIAHLWVNRLSAEEALLSELVAYEVLCRAEESSLARSALRLADDGPIGSGVHGTCSAEGSREPSEP